MLTIKNNEEVYSAPECMVISVKVQGVLCLSGEENSIEDAEERDLGVY